jgi:hypothetical protein
MSNECCHIPGIASILTGGQEELPDALLLIKGQHGITEILRKPVSHNGCLG